MKYMADTPPVTTPTPTPTPAPVPAPLTKPWYTSRTIWFNAIALVALFAQMQTGFVISPDEQGAILMVGNLILRAATNSGLE